MMTLAGSHLLIVSDAWHPQVNGVVRSLTRMVAMADDFGFSARVLGPGEMKTVALPGYSEIRLSCSRFRRIARQIEAYEPDFMHIATEGPLGWQARRWCLARGMAFTTSYHTQFPDYLAARLPVRSNWIYPVLRRFHSAGRLCLVPTANVEQELRRQGFTNLARWGRGVDAEQFQPAITTPGTKTSDTPVFLYVGRVAVEKNLEAFLSLELPGQKIIVGDGPLKANLEARYPDCRFLGKLEGAELSAVYKTADVFVFPSKTDTFGIVLLEALASGVPVAGFPVTGPIDVVGPGVLQNGVPGEKVAVLSDDLKMACLKALELSPKDCRTFALAQSWQASAAQFYGHIQSGLPARKHNLAA